MRRVRFVNGTRTSLAVAGPAGVVAYEAVPPLGGSVDYHAPTPRYPTDISRGPCSYLEGGPCWGDGWTTAVGPALVAVLDGVFADEERTWQFLEERYGDWLGIA